MKSFKQFKIELQLACEKAIADGKVIGKDCCPLGSIIISPGFKFPSSSVAHELWEIDKEDAKTFINAYGSKWDDSIDEDNKSPYYILGREYKFKYPYSGPF